MKINETKIQKLILENPSALLPKLRLINKEFRLYNALTLLKRDIYENLVSFDTKNIIGRIDLILGYNKERLITEIKYNSPTNSCPDFWNSLKVLGYCEYYKWQTGYTFRVHPAIIIPLHSINLEQQIIAGKLGIRLFGVYEVDGKIKLKFVSGEQPVWRQ